MYIFPKIYRFGERELLVFDLGLNFGKTRRTKDIHKVDLLSLSDRKLSEVRAMYDINLDLLRHMRYIERNIFKTKASKRL